MWLKKQNKLFLSDEDEEEEVFSAVRVVSKSSESQFSITGTGSSTCCSPRSVQDGRGRIRTVDSRSSSDHFEALKFPCVRAVS
jgi:hypothetical protein